MAKKRTGVVLIALACALAVAALAWWQWDSSQRHNRQGRADAIAIFTGRTPEDVNVNRAGPLAVSGLSAVLFLSGVVVLAMPDR